MCLPSSCNRSASERSDATNATAPPNKATTQCPCTVTLSPKEKALCGAGKTATLTASGTPAGGTFNWKSSHHGVATVEGSGATTTVKGVAAGKATIKVTYSPSGCTPCTDTIIVKVCTCTAGRKYANAKKTIAKLIGVKAKIKTRYGKLCCEDEGCNTDSAYHVVYVNITKTGGAIKWAQTGYGRERTPGSTAIKKYRYAEMNGTTYKVNYDAAHAPAEGSVHVYKCDLDTSTGTWSFSYDGTSWQTYADTFWKNTPGTDIQWTGEIFNKEDDMPGTAGDKCSFTECQYRVAGKKAYQDAGIVKGDVGIPSPSHDAKEWGEEWVSGTAINIWDKKPLP